MKKTIHTIHGINGSMAVIKSNNCRVKDIFLNNTGRAYKDENLNKIITKKSLNNQIKNFSSLNNFKFDSNRTQGIVVTFEFFGIKDTIDSFFDQSKDHDCILILDQLEDPQNLGQIIRTSECAGVNKIILTQNRSVKLSDSVLQVSQGAFCDISFYICNNLRNTIKILKEEDYWLVALENSIKAQNWHEIDLKGNIGIILGSEGKGVRKLTLEDSDFKATIPMQGTTNSLNVSAACSAILFERLRQISIGLNS